MARLLPARPNAMISAAQCRSARALLGWSVAKLATAASVSASAIDDFEAERRAPLPAVAGPIRRAFEPVGVAFLPGEDVRLRQGRCFELAATTPAFAGDSLAEATPPDHQPRGSRPLCRISGGGLALSVDQSAALHDF